MNYPEGMSVIITDNAVTVDYEEEIYTTRRGVRNFSNVMNILREWNTDSEYEEEDFIDDLLDAFSVNVVVDTENYLAKSGQNQITFVNGNVMYRGEALEGTIVKRIKALAAARLPIDNLLRFMENLYQNPSFASIKQLYGFLEAHNMPISEDGCFIAYKVINGDWTDCHTHSIDNSIGKTISMPRHKVEDNPNKTCSSGLHVCAYPYAKNFFFSAGRLLVAVKVNPRDVVSVPTDYNNAKMRVCAYTVDRLLEKGVEEDVLTGRIYDGYSANIDYDQDPMEDSYDSSWIDSGYLVDEDYYEDYSNDDRNYW